MDNSRTSMMNKPKKIRRKDKCYLKLVHKAQKRRTRRALPELVCKAHRGKEPPEH
jgi:hypothetical protein